MSAFADDPDHFVRWLQARNIPIDDPTTYFAPRRLYGEYLGQLLNDAPKENSSSGRLRVVDEECVGVSQRDEYLEATAGERLKRRSAAMRSGDGHDCSEAGRGQSLLAPSKADEAASARSGRSRPDRRHRSQHGRYMPVAVACTGIQGQIVAVSRRGLLPAVHSKTSPIVLQQADVPLGSGLPEFVRWFRDLVRSTEGTRRRLARCRGRVAPAQSVDLAELVGCFEATILQASEGVVGHPQAPHGAPSQRTALRGDCGWSAARDRGPSA